MLWGASECPSATLLGLQVQKAAAVYVQQQSAAWKKVSGVGGTPRTLPISNTFPSRILSVASWATPRASEAARTVHPPRPLRAVLSATRTRIACPQVDKIRANQEARVHDLIVKEQEDVGKATLIEMHTAEVDALLGLLRNGVVSGMDWGELQARTLLASEACFRSLRIPSDPFGSLRIPSDSFGSLRIPPDPSRSLRIPSDPSGSLQIPSDSFRSLRIPLVFFGSLRIPPHASLLEAPNPTWWSVRRAGLLHAPPLPFAPWLRLTRESSNLDPGRPPALPCAS